MNKKTILGLLTGAAIVAATTGSYAAWDQLSATTTGTLKIGKPITITATTVAFDDETVNKEIHENDFPAYTGKVTFTPDLADKGSANLQVRLAATVSNLESGDYTLTYKKGNDILVDGIDTTVPSAAQEYFVIVTLTDTAKAKVSANAIDVTVNVTATLETVSPAE